MKKNINVIFLFLVSVFIGSCARVNTTPTIQAKEIIVNLTDTPEPPPNYSYRPTDVISISPTLIEEHLPNPGIGWQHEPEEDDFDILQETVAYSDRPLVGWKILNPAEGVYDWTELDHQLRSAIKDGKQFSFRVYTMRGEPYGGHFVPEWVLQKGSNLIASGEPDYSNCTYQKEWGNFVTELAKRYDGNPNIAFIDISGYGNFNEWSWQDDQTRWDELWEQDYSNGLATPASITILDSQARRRLADMFIGGSFDTHECRNADGSVQSLSYAYEGFQKTQLVMPYAGIAQSTEYVFTRRSDVGFRFDCLGTDLEGIVRRLEEELSELWKTAPIVFEFCVPGRFDIGLASNNLYDFHASLVHNNGYSNNTKAIETLMRRVGYKYFLKQAQIQILDENKLKLVMEWQNVGSAPNYPKMGQIFSLHVYLVDSQSDRMIEFPISADISQWMPAFDEEMEPPINQVATLLDLPADLSSGDYQIQIAIINQKNGEPIRLAFSKPDDLGRYPMGLIPIYSKGSN